MPDYGLKKEYTDREVKDMKLKWFLIGMGVGAFSYMLLFISLDITTQLIDAIMQ